MKKAMSMTFLLLFCTSLCFYAYAEPKQDEALPTLADYDDDDDDWPGMLFLVSAEESDSEKSEAQA